MRVFVESSDFGSYSQSFPSLSGTLLSIASIAFSFARPLDRMHPVRPLSSVFHPALFTSLLGQLVIHLGCMWLISEQAKAVMGETELSEVLRFEKERTVFGNFK